MTTKFEGGYVFIHTPLDQMSVYPDYLRELSKTVGVKEEYLKKEKTMKNYDFRVGDRGCHYSYGNGVVIGIEGEYLDVLFDFGANMGFQIGDSFYYRFPFLHGTWAEVFGDVKEVKPKRTKKVKLYKFVYPLLDNSVAYTKGYYTEDKRFCVNTLFTPPNLCPCCSIRGSNYVVAPWTVKEIEVIDDEE